MFKKIVLGSVCLVGTLAGLWSCKESFLESTPSDRISDASYWKTADEFQAAINSAYNAMAIDASSDSWLCTANMPTGDMTPQEDTDYQNLEALRFNANNQYFNKTWSGAWTSITRANLVLNRIAGVNLDPEAKKKLIGEAQFLRGFNYFQLARNFGDVPLITIEQTASSPTDVAKVPVAQVQAQIIKDLTDAAANLPAKWDNDNTGRATKGSALGYLALTNMYLKAWPAADKATQDLMAIGTYDLVKDYRKLFDLKNENNEESVFEIQYRYSESGWGQDAGGQFAGTREAPRGVGEEYVPFGGWGQYLPTKQLVKAFEPNDMRRKACILAPGETYYGYLMRDSTKSSPTNYAFTKYWIGPFKSLWNGLNMTQLRYAEVLLNYAEILNEQGKTADAYTHINRVRARAGLAAKPVGGKDACMDAIMQERRLEGFDGFNFWYDLTRTGKAADFVKKEYGRTLAPHMNLFPSPQRELDLNKALKQNPVYN